MEKVTAAAVQATPVFLDREATVAKACRPDVFRLVVVTRQRAIPGQDPAADGPPADQTAVAHSRPDDGGANHAR